MFSNGYSLNVCKIDLVPFFFFLKSLNVFFSYELKVLEKNDLNKKSTKCHPTPSRGYNSVNFHNMKVKFDMASLNIPNI